VEYPTETEDVAAGRTETVNDAVADPELGAVVTAFPTVIRGAARTSSHTVHDLAGPVERRMLASPDATLTYR
jgi:hypothetical protein